MIRITVEILPHGSEERKRTLGTMVIVNDGMGSRKSGNYDCFLVRKGTNFREYTEKWFRRTRVEQHPRLTFGPWALVRKALEGMYNGTN